jgi:hypothetical protein
VAPGEPDPDDPEVVSVVWALRPGVEVLSAEVVAEGAMLSTRFRVPFHLRTPT